jgi:OFA family oxalate/formate antiporter-like MFS transporter
MYLPQGTELHQRYVIESLLGHGGFGITYAAYDQVLGARVAIKEYLPRHLATRAEGRTQVSVYSGAARQHYDYGLEKFMEEAQVLAQFSHHPNVVSARDFFEANGTAYMVMEYVEGVTLKEYLENKGGRISFEEAQGIMMPVMDALREVHQAGLLHRDISPDNIYITIAAQIRVIDFGAARYYAGEQSKSLSVILKPGYAPEEQYRSSGKQGAWTDVYAVGATLYKALTGQTPPDALDRKEEDTLEPPSRLGVSLRPPVERALMKAMAVSPGQRFQTMGEFQQSFTEGKPMPVKAQPAFTPPPPGPVAPAPAATPIPASSMTPPPAPQALLARVPGRAWVVVLAGAAVNSCLGILYAWSIWAGALINIRMSGQAMTGVNSGWVYLTNAEAATPFSLCVLIFALMMIPGGKLQDKLGPKVGAILGGLLLGLGCIIAGVAKSYAGLVLGFGIFGGIGMGIGYAAATPAALKWFGPHQRGLAAGLVVGGYGFAALYIAPLGAYLIKAGGISYSFVILGCFFFLIITGAGCLLAWPGPGYVAPAPPERALAVHPRGYPAVDYGPLAMLQTWQFYVLALMFIGTTLSGLLIIANGAGLLAATAKASPFFAANLWLLASFGGLMNTLGRIGTGLYSDGMGRANAYTLNCVATALCLFLFPAIIASKSVFLLFIAVGVAFWQYGGGLALIPAYVADMYGTKNLGVNYGLVFFGWVFGFFLTRLGGIIKDLTGSLNAAFYCSGVTLIILITLSQILKNSLKYNKLLK